MIDIKQTIDRFGYDPNILSHGSRKKVVAICDGCGAIRILNKRGYSALCKRCSHLGKHHSEETKQKMRDKKANVSIETRKKISANHVDFSGENNPMFNIHRFGKDAPNYGRKFSEEHRKNLSKSHVGKCMGPKNHNFGKSMSEESRIKVSASKQGVMLEDWYEFTKSQNDQFRNSFEYKNWRNYVFKRDKYTCQECGSSISGTLNAHHILPIRDWRDIQYSLNIMNGITLCKDCHEKTFGREYEFFAKYFDIANGVISC